MTKPINIKLAYAYKDDLRKMAAAGLPKPSPDSSHGIALRLYTEPMSDWQRRKLRAERQLRLAEEFAERVLTRDRMEGVYEIIFLTIGHVRVEGVYEIIFEIMARQQASREAA